MQNEVCLINYFCQKLSQFINLGVADQMICVLLAPTKQNYEEQQF